MMRITNNVDTKHEDIIHDVAYDFYGKRMATCSSDHRVKIWDLGDDGSWNCTYTINKAHNASVWKVAWAHPEYGQVVASCSFDRTVNIYEEQVEEDSKKQSTWLRKAMLVDSRDTVRDIKFAPKHAGLKLATCSADGYVRIYEANDVMNLTFWPLMEEFEARKEGCNCISWNPSKYHSPMIAVGSDDVLIRIWEYNETVRRWQCLDTQIDHSAAVYDVAFAPNVGRSYHLLASCSKDKTVKIWKLIPPGAAGPGADVVSSGKLTVQLAATFKHDSEVWRVEWNVTGTILASSSDDGTVQLYKLGMQPDEWRRISVVNGTPVD
ncbi:nucleoporin Seh1 [Capsaspora owczarzaki ATCC 30864]|uniref:Nucleoporin Seh1 n=1 Tax=Capsaspora owczarzaki (strain ATCC 30864) TaxID=595528 RepID=A0A0D2VR85_CAPO3|nr:nucleoporin Seh1 [Capsaspora owczarzaki ATCC 30864]KJE93357.1 nucleoporin Seh1 [Capsaspora owczarzaki ATCC 30864]|eukprot:XP_004347983.2 nucleoporin Seh1 [Capsaspora owczarzaki ATCC 30864]